MKIQGWAQELDVFTQNINIEQFISSDSSLAENKGLEESHKVLFLINMSNINILL